MQPDPHQRARFLNDEALVAGISRDDQCWLHSHTDHCAECAAYAELTSRILQGLNSFSFEIEPAMHRRVQNAVTDRAQRLGEMRRYSQIRPWRWALIAATLLILATTPIYRNMRHKQHEAEMGRADTLVLERVDAGVSREIPQAMELLNLPGDVR